MKDILESVIFVDNVKLPPVVRNYIYVVRAGVIIQHPSSPLKKAMCLASGTLYMYVP